MSTPPSSTSTTSVDPASRSAYGTTRHNMQVDNAQSDDGSLAPPGARQNIYHPPTTTADNTSAATASSPLQEPDTER